MSKEPVRDRASTLRYSVSSLIKIIKEQDDEKGDVLAASTLQNCFTPKTY